MPLYEYKCIKCDHTDSVFKRMSDVNPEVRCDVCPECGVKDAFVRQVSCPHTDLREFAEPIEMFSIALNHDDEIAEFKRKAPGVDIETDPNHPNYGIPIARSRKQKLEALKAVGYQEAN